MSDRPDDVEILKERLSEDPTDAFLERIASSVVDEIEDSFPELSLKARPMADVLEEFRKKKLDEVKSEGQYNRKLDYLQTYLLQEVGVETTEDLTSEDVERYDKWWKYESLDREKPMSDNTLRDDMYLFREFIQYSVDHIKRPTTPSSSR